MPNKYKYIIYGLVFAGLLVGTGFTQLQLKNMPLILMLIWSTLTVFFYFVRQNSIFTILFYILLWTMLYLSLSTLTIGIIETVRPDSGWVTFKGERHRVMGANWVWGFIVGLILSSLTLFVYHKTKIKNHVLEMTTTTLFIVMTLILLLK